MAGQTTYLQLSLPGLGEFNNSWHTPNNQNFETIDDFAEAIKLALVDGSTINATYAALTGDFANLAARLDVSINSNGTIDLSGSPEILDLASSLIDGTFTAPTNRFEASDLERRTARNPVPSDRFTPSSPGISTAWGDIESGRSLLARDYNSPTYSPAGMEGGIPTPSMPAGHGYIDGPATLLATAGFEQVKIAADDVPGMRALFNIDGYLFSIREPIILDLSAAGLGSPETIYIFVERDESEYGNAAYLYTCGTASVAAAAKDLRQLQAGATPAAGGTTSITGKTFTVSGATFVSAALESESPVKTNDLLVIYGGTDADGSYTILSVAEEVLTLEAAPRAARSGLSWYVYDPAMPNIGFEDPAIDTSPPAVSSGRALIGQVQYNGAGSNISAPVTYAKNGVYDSGWLGPYDAADIAALGALNHNLGVHPTHVDIFVRETIGAAASNDAKVYEPLVQRKFSFVDDAGYPDPATSYEGSMAILVPSLRWRATATTITLSLTASPLGTQHLDPAIFTDEGGAEYGDGAATADVQIRIIVRR